MWFIISIFAFLLILFIVMARSKDGKEGQSNSSANHGDNLSKGISGKNEFNEKEFKKYVSDLETYSNVSHKNAVLFEKKMKSDPLYYPKTRDALCRLSEHEVQEYHQAVAERKKGIEENTLLIEASFYLPNYTSWAISALKKAIKKGETDKARNIANFLYYCFVIHFSRLTEDSTCNDSELWIEKYSKKAKQFNYLSNGLITGYRGGELIQESSYCKESYKLIEQVLGKVEVSTDWHSIRSLVEEEW